MMGGWKGIRTSASFTGTSSGVPKRFVSAPPSRSAVRAPGRAKAILENTLILLRGGGGFGGRINRAARRCLAFASWSIPQCYSADAVELPDAPAPIPAIADVRYARDGSPNTQQRLAH